MVHVRVLLTLPNCSAQKWWIWRICPKALITLHGQKYETIRLLGEPSSKFCLISDLRWAPSQAIQLYVGWHNSTYGGERSPVKPHFLFSHWGRGPISPHLKNDRIVGPTLWKKHHQISRPMVFFGRWTSNSIGANAGTTTIMVWVVVSNMFYFQPYSIRGRFPFWIFQMGLKPPTSGDSQNISLKLTLSLWKKRSSSRLEGWDFGRLKLQGSLEKIHFFVCGIKRFNGNIYIYPGSPRPNKERYFGWFM